MKYREVEEIRIGDSTGEPEEIRVGGRPGEPEREVFARATLSPVMKAATTMIKFKSVGAEFDVADLIVVLDHQVSKTLGGNKLEEAQRMLVAQAHTLDAIFNNMAFMAVDLRNPDYSKVELYMRLALKAQSQSRATWLALSEIRNPRLANVVNQANISAGHQQVNNYAERRQQSEIAPNELLEKKRERVDFGAPEAASGKHCTVEAVEAVNRPKKRGRKKQVVT